MGFAFLPVSPNTDHDIYSYKWDGFVSASNINPYQHPPIFYTHSKISAAFPFWTSLQFKEYTAIYPYVSQYIFYIDHILFGFSILGTKLFFLFFLVASIPIFFSLSSKLGSKVERIWLFIANPLVLYETCGSVHNDIIVVFFFLLALNFLLGKKEVKAGVFFAFAIATKFIPLFLLFVFSKHSKNLRFLLFVIITLGILYIPSFFYIPFTNVFSTLFKYESEWTYVPGIYGFFSYLLITLHISNSKLLLKVLYWFVLILLISILFIKKHSKSSLIRECEIIIGYVLLANSVYFPWYCLWILCIIPFLKKSKIWLILSITSFLIPINGYSNEGMDFIKQVIIWIPVYLTILYENKTTIFLFFKNLKYHLT